MGAGSPRWLILEKALDQVPGKGSDPAWDVVVVLILLHPLVLLNFLKRKLAN